MLKRGPGANLRTVEPSFCRICTNLCPILVEVEDGRAARVTGDPGNPMYQGFTCPKGRAQVRFLDSPDRLLHSRVRRPDGSFAPIPLDEALDEIAAKLRRILGDQGPGAVAAYWGSMISANAAVVPFLEAFMAAIGSPLVFTPATIDKAGRHVAKALHGYWQAPRQGYDDPDVALLVGLNPLVSFNGAPLGNPGRWLRDQLGRGMQLIVIDPRRSDVARRATLHLQPRPGADAAILGCMVRTVLDERLFDAAFVDENVSGLDALRSAVQALTPARVAAAAGVDAEDLVRAARLYAKARRGYAAAGTGPNMAGSGTLVEYLVLVLETLCGRWLRAGERVRNPGVLVPAFPARAQAGGPRPAYGFGHRMAARGLRQSAAGLPTGALADEMLLEGEGRVRALFSVGGNPASAWPDQVKTVDALRSLDLLVHVDPWMSQTAALAHYVIAPRMPLEMAGATFLADYQSTTAPLTGSVEPFGQWTPAIVEPPQGSEVIEDWELFHGLARRMGLDLELKSLLGSFVGCEVEPYRVDLDRRPTTDELLDVLARGSRTPLETVRADRHGVFAPEPSVVVAEKEPGWTGRLEVGSPEMMADLAQTAAALDPAAEAPADLPLRLLCRRVMHRYNSSCNAPETNRGRNDNPLWMSPADAAQRGLATGDLAEIRSALANLVARVELDADLRPGVVALTHGFGQLPEFDDLLAHGVNVNRLLPADLGAEPYSGQPTVSNVPVEVARAR